MEEEVQNIIKKDKNNNLSFSEKPIKQSKIQKYNLDEVAWKLFWTHSKGSSDIATVLNMVLDKRRDALASTGRLPDDWKYTHISARDVTDFLRNMQLRIDREEGKRITKLRRKTIDSVRQLEGVMIELGDSMDAWGDKVKDLMAQDDYEKAIKFYKVFQKDREQRMSMIKMLIDLRSKFKTYVAFDVLSQKVRQMIYIIEEEQGLPFEMKDKMLSYLGDIMRQAKLEYAED